MPQFEIYWKRLDPNNTGRVAPMDAAKFLKSSGLSDHTLGKVRESKSVMCPSQSLFTRHLSIGVRLSEHLGAISVLLIFYLSMKVSSLSRNCSVTIKSAVSNFERNLSLRINAEFYRHFGSVLENDLVIS